MDIQVTYQGSVGNIVDQWTRKLNPALAREVLRLANAAGGHIAKIAMAVFRRGSGELARSFLPARFVSDSSGIAAGALSDLPYAAAQDRPETTIFPKTVKNLAVPLTSKASKMWPRDWPKDALTLIPRPVKSLLVTMSGKGAIQPQYVLMPSVTLRGKNYLEQAANAAELQAAGESPYRLAEEMQQDEQGGGD